MSGYDLQRGEAFPEPGNILRAGTGSETDAQAADCQVLFVTPPRLGLHRPGWMTYKIGMARIVVVDDEMTMVQMVTELLRTQGHEVLPFTNGNAALDCLEGQAPELVITDLNLERSRTQGLDILQKARTLNPPASTNK